MVVGLHELQPFEQGLKRAVAVSAGALHIEALLRGMDAHRQRTGMDEAALGTAAGLDPEALAAFRAEHSQLLEEGASGDN